jgi:acetyl esterase/lipase
MANVTFLQCSLTLIRQQTVDDRNSSRFFELGHQIRFMKGRAMTAVLKLGLIGLVLVLGLNCGLARGQGQVEPQRIGLWNGRASLGTGQVQETEVWITAYRPAKPTGTAIVICPGGGYSDVVVQPEGHGIATWLNGHGVTGVVLEYRLPAGRHDVPLLDAQRAIRTVRAHATEWAIDPTRIGIIGFSAGGHLAATAATHFDDGDSKATDPTEHVSCRPDFAILIYPVITMGARTHRGSRDNLLGKNPTPELIELYSNEKQVTAKTSPTFLAHAQNDTTVVPANSKMFYDALQMHHVPAQYLELPSGGHALHGYKGPMWDAWQEKSLAWLTELNLLPQATTGKTVK